MTSTISSVISSTVWVDVLRASLSASEGLYSITSCFEMLCQIGRSICSPGAKADLVLVDVNHPSMQPVHDPLRSLINTAAERPVRDVIIDGAYVVKDGRVLTLDYLGTSQKLEAVRQRMGKMTSQHDRAGRKAEELSPLALPIDNE